MGNILVCDDERSICEMLDISLRKDGHRVETVNGGDAAKAKGKGGQGKGQRKGGGGPMSKMDPATKEKFRNASPEEKRKILEENGVPPDRIDRILDRINSGGGFGPPGPRCFG